MTTGTALVEDGFAVGRFFRVCLKSEAEERQRQ
jgi:hypothetical protein